MRYTGTAHDISYSATLDFFDARGRAARADAPQTATMYQDDDLARRRDAWEEQTVLPLLRLRSSDQVLDIGCGYGRWATKLAGRVGCYLGLDFSAELLRLARAQDIRGARFQQLAAQDICPDTLVVSPPFDLFICSGILIYLNDADITKVARAIAAMASDSARVYLREPMAHEARLTLDRFASPELKRDYSAVYRTKAELHALLSGPFAAAGLRLQLQFPLYPRELCNRKETEQQIQLWTKS